MSNTCDTRECDGLRSAYLTLLTLPSRPWASRTNSWTSCQIPLTPLQHRPPILIQVLINQRAQSAQAGPSRADKSTQHSSLVPSSLVGQDAECRPVCHSRRGTRARVGRPTAECDFARIAQKAICQLERRMRCANPKCNEVMLDASGGTMKLLELDLPPEARVEGSEWGFPVLCAPSRYFWLCDDCSRLYRIRRWTRDGVRLEATFVLAGSQEAPGKPPATHMPSVRSTMGPVRSARIA